MQRVATISKKVLQSYKVLPSKKQYIEVITAILSVPVLFTAILLNINNLKAINNAKTTAAPTPAVKQQTIYVPVNTDKPASQKSNNSANATNSLNSADTTSTTPSPCKPQIGPVSIDSPDEGDTVTDNPVSISINYQTGTYCAVVWSYRINGGNWSDYDDKSIALYNLPQGKIKIEVKVKSIVSGDEQILTRNFTYKGGSSTPTAAPDTQNTKTSSNSAN